jgi:hypothetical protein
MLLWYAIVHLLGIDYGLPYGHWSWYNFWSGVGGSFLVNALVFGFLLWWRSTCHHSWRCLRHGKHPAAGGMFRLCWKHHPDLGEKPSPELIRVLHSQWKGAAGTRKG